MSMETGSLGRWTRRHPVLTAFLAGLFLALCLTGCGDRGQTAVDLCRDHGGVSALDDDVVICADQSFFEGAADA